MKIDVMKLNGFDVDMITQHYTKFVDIKTLK